MFQEKNFLKPSVQEEHIYLNRQKALREMEDERDEGKLVLNKGKTWEELVDWAECTMARHGISSVRPWAKDEKEAREAVEPNDRRRKGLKVHRRLNLMREMQVSRDEEILSRGETWQEITAWPPRFSSPIQSFEADVNAISSPSSSEHSDNSMISTFPPTPSDIRREVMVGLQPIYPQKGYMDDLDWKGTMSSENWEGLEWGLSETASLKRNTKKRR